MRGRGWASPVQPAGGHPQPSAIVARMLKLIVVLLVIWAAFAVIGFVIEGLLWLAFLGLVLLVATAVWGWFRRRATRD